MKSYKDIGCRNCGAVLPMEVSNLQIDEKNVWFPGKKCPMCGSQEFYPTIKPSEPANVKIKKEWRYNPYYGLVALGIVIILIPVFLLVTRKGSQMASRDAMLVCDECGEVFSDKVTTKPPYLCPKCNKKTAYGALYCVYDFVIYPWKINSSRDEIFPPCPICGKTKPALLKDEKDFADVKSKRKQIEDIEKKAKESGNVPQ